MIKYTEKDLVPEWTHQKRDIYEYLISKSPKELTELENKFCRTMYHLEEGVAGLL